MGIWNMKMRIAHYSTMKKKCIIEFSNGISWFHLVASCANDTNGIETVVPIDICSTLVRFAKREIFCIIQMNGGPKNIAVDINDIAGEWLMKSQLRWVVAMMCGAPNGRLLISTNGKTTAAVSKSADNYTLRIKPKINKNNQTINHWARKTQYFTMSKWIQHFCYQQTAPINFAVFFSSLRRQINDQFLSADAHTQRQQQRKVNEGTRNSWKRKIASIIFWLPIVRVHRVVVDEFMREFIESGKQTKN